MQNSIINIDPEIMGGTPVFRGTRVPIYLFFEVIKHGDCTIDEFVEDYPTVNKQLIAELLDLYKEKLLGKPELV